MKWWQPMAGRLIDFAKHFLDDSQPVEKVQAFLQSRLERTTDNDGGISQEAGYAFYLATDLDLLPRRQGVSASHPSLPSLSEFNRWRENLIHGRVIDRSGLASGAGLMLLSILDDPGQHDTFLQSELERLMRRVEVKRREALDPAAKLDSEGAWLERHAIAILFSRTARQTKDLRFLNSALKLNDWALPSHLGLRAGARLDRYLWSLAEQETSWMELVA